MVPLQISIAGFCGTLVLGDGNWLFNETRQTNQKTRLQSSKKAASVESPGFNLGRSQSASCMTGSGSCTEETCLITLKAGVP